MKEEENIVAYFLRVDETMNIIRGLGEKIEEPIIVQKILRSLPMRFCSKISTIEERIDLDTMTVDELHGTLTAYEMRTEQEDPSGKEAAFKASNQKGTSKQKSKSKYSNHDESDSEEEANFVRNLRRGTCKYKGKLPLKCFKCGRIGHFASKCPYAKNPNSNDENNCKKNESLQKYKKGNNGRFAKSKNIYSKEDNNSSDNDTNNDDDMLFMAIDTIEIHDDHEGSEEEGEVDLEAELISSLEELNKERKKNKLLKKD